MSPTAPPRLTPRLIPLTLSLAALGAAPALMAQSTVVKGEVSVHTPPASQATRNGTDFGNAKPMALPRASSAPQTQTRGAASTPQGSAATLASPGRSVGARGNGKQTPQTLIAPANLASTQAAKAGSATNGLVRPQEFGQSGQPYTTSRVDLDGSEVSTLYPYRAAGKLYFNTGSGSAVCSASLIKPGILVTAAHCVAEFGAGRFYSDFEYVPAFYRGYAPYGTWAGATVYVQSSYLRGTADCINGVVCENDIALIRLRAKRDEDGKAFYAGHLTGWLGYGWDGYGYASGATLINQLGYPVSHDYGEMMQRTDSPGVIDSTVKYNTVIGSRQTGGSSGGPWVLNLGELGTLNDTEAGLDGGTNIITGVTSWGYTDGVTKQQGASPFLTSNIVRLMEKACPSSSSPGCR